MASISKKSILYVSIQFACLCYLLIDFSFYYSLVDLLIKTAGIILILWAALVGGVFNFNIQPEVKSDVLITKAPFSVIRNPMYLGILLIFGVDIYYQPTTIRVVVYLVLLLILLLKIFAEEKFLEEKFKNSYKEYKKQSFRLIPFVF